MRQFECAQCHQSHELINLKDFYRDDLLCETCGSELKYQALCWSVLISILLFNVSTMLGFLVVFSKLIVSISLLVFLIAGLCVVLKIGNITYQNKQQLKSAHFFQNILGWIIGTLIFIIQFKLMPI